MRCACILDANFLTSFLCLQTGIQMAFFAIFYYKTCNVNLNVNSTFFYSLNKCCTFAPQNWSKFL